MQKPTEEEFFTFLREHLSEEWKAFSECIDEGYIEFKDQDMEYLLKEFRFFIGWV